MGAGMSISIFMILFYMVFVLVAGLILFTIIKGIAQWSNNNKQPVLTVPARISSKRSNTRTSSNTSSHTHSTSYYVTFEVESGDRMELQVSGQEYGLLAENDTGRLTFQGTRYLGFDRQI